MQPLDLISWSLAIGVAWAVFALLVPVERIGNFFARRQVRIKELEERVTELERRIAPPQKELV